jgi:hypothetical protein
MRRVCSLTIALMFVALGASGAVWASDKKPGSAAKLVVVKPSAACSAAIKSTNKPAGVRVVVAKGKIQITSKRPFAADKRLDAYRAALEEGGCSFYRNMETE